MTTTTAALIFLTLFSLSGEARWANLNDSPAVQKTDKQSFKVKKDGTFTLVRESTVEIRNEEGRNQLGTATLRYNSRASKIENIEAYTITQNQKYEVEKEYIEDNPISSPREGFDETRQIAIAYPKVEVGSVIFLKYEMSTHEVPIANFYSEAFHFGEEVYEESADITIESELPLFWEKNDPRKSLEVTSKTENGKAYLHIKNLKPIYVKPVDEEDVYLDPKDKTVVVLSSQKNYGFLANSVVNQYEAVLNSPLPEAFEKIRAAAAQKKTLVEQINTITSQLADEVRYLGDWRPYQGGHIPRPLETIAKTKFGDCKDYSAVTASILRKMGKTAYIAWVERDYQPSPLPQLALDAAFNHAIVAVIIDGKPMWIDPTNFVSFAQGIFEDIMDRDALIIEPVQSKLARIPLGKSSESVLERTLNYSTDKEGDTEIRAEIHLMGRIATRVAGLSKEASDDTINHTLAKIIAEENYIKWFEVMPFDLKSRVVRDVKFTAKVGVKNFFWNTTAGTALPVVRTELKKIMDLESHQRVSSLFLGFPARGKTVSELNGVRGVGAPIKECKIDSPWVEARRVFVRKGKKTKIEDTVDYKKWKISREEYQSPEFLKVQKDLQKCFRNIGYVFK